METRPNTALKVAENHIETSETPRLLVVLLPAVRGALRDRRSGERGRLKVLQLADSAGGIELTHEEVREALPGGGGGGGGGRWPGGWVGERVREWTSEWTNPSGRGLTPLRHYILAPLRMPLEMFT